MTPDKIQDHGRGRKADAGLDGEASRRVRIFAAGAIPKRRKGKTRGVASNRWQFYEAQLGPIVSEARRGAYAKSAPRFESLPPTPAVSTHAWAVDVRAVYEWAIPIRAIIPIGSDRTAGMTSPSVAMPVTPAIHRRQIRANLGLDLTKRRTYVGRSSVCGRETDDHDVCQLRQHPPLRRSIFSL